MKKMIVRRTIAVTVMAALLFTGISCQMFDYKPLCYDHDHVVELEVLFDWSDCPGAQPQQMSVYAYSLNNPGMPPERFDSEGCARSVFNLRFGSYRLLALNSDTEAVLYKDVDSIGRFTSYTRESSYSEGTLMPSDGTEGSPFILEPEMLWASTSEDMYLEMMEGHRTITLQMHPRTIEVTIAFKDVDNIKYTSELGCAISGMNTSVVMASGQNPDSTAYQAFVERSKGEKEMSGRFVIFGHGTDTVPHKFKLYAMLENDTRWEFPIDLTEKMNDPANMVDNSHMYIEITDNVPVPKPIRNGGGLHPSVDGWFDEYIDVTMLKRL